MGRCPFSYVRSPAIATPAFMWCEWAWRLLDFCLSVWPDFSVPPSFSLGVLFFLLSCLAYLAVCLPVSLSVIRSVTVFVCHAICHSLCPVVSGTLIVPQFVNDIFWSALFLSFCFSFSLSLTLSLSHSLPLSLSLSLFYLPIWLAACLSLCRSVWPSVGQCFVFLGVIWSCSLP